MPELEVVCRIGNEICEGCGPDRDCGLEYNECDRIDSALDILAKFIAHGIHNGK